MTALFFSGGYSVQLNLLNIFLSIYNTISFIVVYFSLFAGKEREGARNGYRNTIGIACRDRQFFGVG